MDFRGPVISLLMLSGMTSSATFASKVFDSEAVTDSVPPLRGTWVKQLVESGFKINDPRINYPKFARFCVKVYNWGDRTFNSYDPEYVVSTGKNWKLFAHNDAWMQSYVMMFRDRSYIRLQSNIQDDFGANLSFMALNIGYTLNTKTLFTRTQDNRNRFNFNFVCALFSISLYTSSVEGGTKITHFGHFEPVRHDHLNFNDIRNTTFSANGLYFFNHRHYSHAAAYCYSKYQLKSASSWMAGVSYSNQNIRMDFSNLNPEMLVDLPIEQRDYRFHYRDYCISGGYGYNWVLRPQAWLFNITVSPSAGLRTSYEDATEGHKYMLSTNLRGMFSLVYNHRALYASLNGSAIAYMFNGHNYTFVNSNLSLHTTVGIRF